MKVKQVNLLPTNYTSNKSVQQKVFVSTGVELFKNITSNTEVLYTNIASNATRNESYSYNGGRIGGQFMAGLGYNFKALGFRFRL
jgi:hypothetical protein